MCVPTLPKAVSLQARPGTPGVLSFTCGVASVPRRSVELQIYAPFRSSVSRAWLRRLVTEALAAVDPGGGRGASVVVADDATLRDLNSRYLGSDEPTDVLAFPWEEPVNGSGPKSEVTPFPAPPAGERPLGEVLVSYPQAQRQARERGQPAEREVALLVVHGLLHLLGHDHAEPGEAAVMRGMEQKALERVFSEPVPSKG